MDKDLHNRLNWLQEELLEGEEPEFLPPPRRQKLSQAEKSERRRLEQLDPVEKRSAPVVKKKGIKGLVLLAVLEILGILLVIGWWLTWLM